MPPTPLQQKLLVACCGCAAVVAALLPGALSHSQPPAPQVLSVGVGAHPAVHEHRPGTLPRTTAPTAASSAPTPAHASARSTAAQPTVRHVVAVPHVSTTPQLPAAVTGLHLTSATGSTMDLAWQASADAVSYRVLVDGVAAASVTSPAAELDWPVGTARVLVQVAAVDADGVASELRALVLVRSVTPPTPAPTTAGASTPTATPSSASTSVTAPAQAHPAVSASTLASGVPGGTVNDAGAQAAGVGHNA